MFKNLTSKNGYEVLSYQNKPLHSLFDPLKEAAQWVSSVYHFFPSIKDDPVIFLGVGSGYHLVRFLSDVKNHERILIVCFDPIEKKKLKDLLSQSKIDFDQIILHSDIFSLHEWFKKIAHQLKRVQLVEYRSVTRFFSVLMKDLVREIQKAQNYQLQNQATQLVLGGLWVLNVIQNIPHLIKKQGTLLLRNSVVLISAGPSLNSQIQDIKTLQKKMPIVVVDTALPVLMEHGIIPDIILSCDAQIHNYYDFFIWKQSFKDSKKTYLIADLTHCPHITRLFDKVIFYCGEPKGYDIVEYLIPELISIYNLMKVEAGGSVASFGLSVLKNLGVSNIILIGQDLVESQISHAKGTIFYNQVLYGQGRYRSFWSQYSYLIKNDKNEMLENLSLWIEDFFRLYSVNGYHKSPQRNLKNIKKYNDEISFSGQMIEVKKKEIDKNIVKNIKLQFLELQAFLSILRNSKNSKEFEELRVEVYPDLMNILLGRVDLYKRQIKNCDEQLYLGSSFFSIDKLRKALKRALLSFNK